MDNVGDFVSFQKVKKSNPKNLVVIGTLEIDDGCDHNCVEGVDIEMKNVIPIVNIIKKNQVPNF